MTTEPMTPVKAVGKAMERAKIEYDYVHFCIPPVVFVDELRSLGYVIVPVRPTEDQLIAMTRALRLRISDWTWEEWKSAARRAYAAIVEKAAINDTKENQSRQQGYTCRDNSLRHKKWWSGSSV